MYATALTQMSRYKLMLAVTMDVGVNVVLGSSIWVNSFNSID